MCLRPRVMITSYRPSYNVTYPILAILTAQGANIIRLYYLHGEHYYGTEISPKYAVLQA